MGTHPIFESDFDCLTEAIMSDTEAPAAAPAPVAAQGYSVETAVQETLKHAQHRDGLARGLNEAVRALERRDAICCILAENCDEANYVRLIEALCVEHQIPICKIDREGNAVKVVGCSCVVREVDDNAAWDYLQ